MGIPAQRLIRILRPAHEEVYGIMRDHYVLFCQNWIFNMTEEEKALYLGERLGHANRIDLTLSFSYIENLPDIPAKKDIIDLAYHVKSGILAYSLNDHDLNDGLVMGVYADYILENVDKKNLTYENEGNQIILGPGSEN